MAQQASESRVMLMAKTKSNGESLKFRRTQFAALPQNPGLTPQFGGVLCSAMVPGRSQAGDIWLRGTQKLPEVTLLYGQPRQVWGCKGYRTPVVAQRAELLYPGKDVACSSTATNAGDR